MIEPNHKILCRTCCQELVLADPSDYCLSCAANLWSERGPICEECRRFGKLCRHAVPIFEELPAPHALIRLFQRGAFYLARSLAAFMVLQFYKLKWNQPDIITFTPVSFSTHLSCGYNPSALLAKELGKLITVPVKSLLKVTMPFPLTPKAYSVKMYRKDPQVTRMLLISIQRGQDPPIRSSMLALRELDVQLKAMVLIS